MVTWILGSDNSFHLLAVVTLLGAICWFITYLSKRSYRNLPPGPKGLPFIGDVRHAVDPIWLASPERKNEYGELMYTSTLGQGILVINSQRVAIDLLEKRSNIYSDRQRFISAGDYMTENLSFTLTPYDDVWRRFRRASMDSFSKSAVSRFYPIQNREAIMLTLGFMKSPSALQKHFERHALSILLSVNYHHPPTQSEDDPIVVALANHVRRLLHEMEPGVRLVEFFPWLRYIPSRFTQWKQNARFYYNHDSLMFEGLVKKVADDLANGIDQPSFSASLIKNQSKHNLSERERAWLAGDMLAAGTETTSTTLHWWLLAILVYPDVQARAHAELDEIVGYARPPTFSDLPSLPYIRAMVKETLRWAVIAPFAVPHVSTTDDWYEGMYIPKGTICLPNIKVLNSDPNVFGKDAERFDPARHLNKKGEEVKAVMMDGREEGHVTFGFGRRLCVGKHLAEGTLAIDFATMLWAMKFERPEGAVKGELDVHTLVRSSLTTRPAPFEYKALPRFPEAVALLKEALELYQ
ncbi:cytochrome P450 [Multifurca ochricompacta]|uniref:Cytochrome P450 n=1 Tax=Multifurca ochricompacta TaxID=376703 RepID=A0AAD4LZT0_9AGAM|nr:cytochrome P450 [Multifurca ochricompacta]